MSGAYKVSTSEVPGDGTNRFFFLLKSLLAPKLLQSLERVFSWNSNLDIEEIGVQGEKH
jgi:hypothetical protein